MTLSAQHHDYPTLLTHLVIYMLAMGATQNICAYIEQHSAASHCMYVNHLLNHRNLIEPSVNGYLSIPLFK